MVSAAHRYVPVFEPTRTAKTDLLRRRNVVYRFVHAPSTLPYVQFCTTHELLLAYKFSAELSLVLK